MPSEAFYPDDQEASSESLYRLVLFNDDEHSYDYVISMLTQVVGVSIHEARHLAYEIDYIGEATVKLCSYDEAAFLRDQIVTFGPDPNIEESRGSMTVAIQPYVEINPSSDAL